MRSDYHVHTEFSDDSEYEMEQVVLDAIELGLTEIAFTDHVDYGIKRDWDDPAGMIYRKGGPGEPEFMPLANVDYPRYVEKILSLQEKYKSKIKIKIGLEFGMQRHTIPSYSKLFERYPFDFIILSVHEVENKEFWTGDFQKGLTREEYYRKYYMEMLTLVENYKNYSVLGHMDLIARYDGLKGTEEEAFKRAELFEQMKPIITKILSTVISDGKGIEINTSSLRYGIESTPSTEILELYRDLGGEILTIGSDSHKKEHLGVGIDEAMKKLKNLGFSKICTYDQMRPEFHKIF